MNTEDEIKRILTNLSQGEITASAYDTAWVARIREDGKPLFPEALNWILTNQNEDGSWGDDEVNQPFDKAISTLICIIALKENGASSEVIRRGLMFLNSNISNLLNTEERLTVGFEVIFPELIKVAEFLDINLDNKEVKEYFTKLKEVKLKKLPLEYLYRMKTVYNYSLEFLNSTDADFNLLAGHMEENGSFASSPSSTAFMYLKTHSSQSIAYIKTLLDKFGYIPNFYPFEEFERSWIINYFIELGLEEEFKPFIQNHAAFLEKRWNDSGIAFSQYFGVPDLDITCTIFKVLNKFGYKHSVSVFKSFETEEGFFCYFGESETSMSHMANFIDCLETSNIDQEDLTEKERLLEKAKSFVKSKDLLTRLNDKWNTSIYYTFSRIGDYSSLGEHFVNKTKDLILSSQNKNGSWGRNNGDPEETCWALISLFKILGEEEFKMNAQIISAHTYLVQNNIQYPVRSNWISKVLYCPLNIRNILILLMLFKLKKLQVEVS